MKRETLVFLPGMMCDERLFAPQVEAFRGQYDIVIPKLCETSIEEMARNVLSSISTQKFNLVGLSMGGIVAMEIMRQASHRILRLALLDTNHLADASENYANRNRQIKDIQNGKLRDVIVTEMKPHYLAEKNMGNKALLSVLIEMAMDVGGEVFIAQSTALRDRRSQIETLKAVHQPTLILCGDEDALCPPERHQQMATLISNGQMLSIKNAGHISTLEAPEEVNQWLMKWVSVPVIHRT
ncbi:alpha/beta fold hydrolase [Ahrensia kielensis]|uniref:Alpha/beta fold hydrolase n=1 Tax=Ahrensia kielensis TaxID=76980 RepID=A0ABU9TA65_9HYPH